MPENDYNATTTEAVAVFHDAGQFQAAVDELLTHGFDYAELSVLASEEAIKSKLGRSYRSTGEFEDTAEAPRVIHVPDESIGNAQGGIIAVSAYIPAMLGSIAVAATGGTLAGAIAVAAVAAGAGAAAGALLAAFIGRTHAKHLDEHIKHGGLLLWVRTHDAVHEGAALDILKRNGGADVHLHELPASAERIAAIATKRPLISLNPAA